MGRAGTRTCFVTVQRLIDTRDPVSNAKTQEWLQFTKAWVSIEPKRGTERAAAGSVESAVTHDIRGEYHDFIGVKVTDRIIFEGRVINIVGKMPDETTHADVLLHGVETDEVL